MPSNRPTLTHEQRPSQPVSTGVRVLVVNDHRVHVESMARLLRLYGHDVETALGGFAALNAAKAQSPDVVLLDISMPGMDGFEVARQLRLFLPPESLIVALTALGSPEDRNRCIESGCNLHLVKPADPLQLESLLRGLAASLARRRPENESVADGEP